MLLSLELFKFLGNIHVSVVITELFVDILQHGDVYACICASTDCLKVRRIQQALL